MKDRKVEGNRLALFFWWFVFFEGLGWFPL